MIPEIGVVIAFYVVTRMLENLERRWPRFLAGMVAVFSILTLVVAVVVAIDLVLRGTNYTINPFERY